MPDSRGFLLPSEKQILLRRYAPVLVLFPHDVKRAPYPDEGDAIYAMRGSYHPIDTHFFLKQAKVRYRRRVVLRNPLLLLKPRSYSKEKNAIEVSLNPAEIDEAVERHQYDPQFAGLEDVALYEAVRDLLVKTRLSQRVRGFDLSLYHAKNIDHWREYFKVFHTAEPPDRRSIVYGRVVQGLAPPQEAGDSAAVVPFPNARFGPYDVSRVRVALQYWFHYYYDDWANRHEGDWESITLLATIKPELIAQSAALSEAELLAGVTVLDAGYAAHEDGYRRRWIEVEKTAEERPIVYVARGSSASYFSWRLEGYPASARVGFFEKALSIPGFFIGPRRFLGRRWDAQYFARFTARGPKNTDWVAADPMPEDRAPGPIPNLQERQLKANCHENQCQGVRRRPDFGPDAGQSEDTYYLETDDLFWVDMVQQYGLQWGENSLWPGTQGPRGLKKAERDRKNREIERLGRLEAIIAQVLHELSDLEFSAANAIPDLDPIFQPLRPANLRSKDCLTPKVRPYVYQMWAWLLKIHPEAWPGGPGLWLRWAFARQLRPGFFSFLRRARIQPLLDRQDPVYHVKTLFARVRQTRYEVQHQGAKWDNPFSWVRYTCLPDSFFYGKVHDQAAKPLEFYFYDCIDEDLTTETPHHDRPS